MEFTSLARLNLPLQVTFQMLVSYTILVSLTFILLTELSQILVEMHEGSKYVLQISEVLWRFHQNGKFSLRAWNLFNLWNRNDALLGTRFEINKFHWSCWTPKFYTSKNTQIINLTWSIFIATSHSWFIYIYNFWDLINQSWVHLYLPLNSTRR